MFYILLPSGNKNYSISDMFPGRGHAGTKSKLHNEPAHVSAGRATFYKLWLNCEFVLF